MKFIRLHLVNGVPIYINPALIFSLETSANRKATAIGCSADDNGRTVTETPGQILRLIGATVTQETCADTQNAKQQSEVKM